MCVSSNDALEYIDDSVMNSPIPPPSRISLDENLENLTLAYESGVSFSLSAEYLRVMAPSADVQGHGGAGGHLVDGKRHVKLEAVERVGNYAVRLIFSDGHRNGIYTWKTLLSLGVNHERNWQDYLAALELAGTSRDE